MFMDGHKINTDVTDSIMNNASWDYDLLSVARMINVFLDESYFTNDDIVNVEDKKIEYDMLKDDINKILVDINRIENISTIAEELGVHSSTLNEYSSSFTFENIKVEDKLKQHYEVHFNNLKEITDEFIENNDLIKSLTDDDGNVYIKDYFDSDIDDTTKDNIMDDISKFEKIGDIIKYIYDNKFSETIGNDTKVNVAKFLLLDAGIKGEIYFVKLNEIYEYIFENFFRNITLDISGELNDINTELDKLKEKKDNLKSLLNSILGENQVQRDNVQTDAETEYPGINFNDPNFLANYKNKVKNSENITLKIKLEENKFIINKEEYKYEEDMGNLVKNFKSELNKINIKEVIDENENKMDNIRKKNEEIDRIKLIKSDNLTPRRRLQYLEKWDQDIFKELVGLIGYLIIGVCFGIYCIYNFFVLQLK